MILAAIEPWLERTVAIATILGLAIAWYVASRKKEVREIKNDPLNVRLRKARAAEEDCSHRHEQAIAAVALLRQENEQEHRRLYDQIDTVEHRMDDKLTEAIRQFNNSIQDMPFKVLAALRNAGQMKDHH